jgi:hypothetical protein
VSFSRLWGDSDSDALEKAHCAAAMKIQVLSRPTIATLALVLI